MPRDAAATRRRIIDAAILEFAERGLAGGRVDRIAAVAEANKRAIYDYFGSKEALFAIVVERVARELQEAVPLDPDDLPAYAGALYHHLQSHPETARLIGWRRLERPDLGSPTSPEFVELMARVRPPRRAATAGGDTLIEPDDVVGFVVALANAWDVVGRELEQAAGGDPDDPARVARHRAGVVEAVRRIVGG